MDYIAPGVLMAHGDEGAVCSQNGLMAVNLGIRTGQNVVCGHSHRQGISKSSRGFGGRLNTIWGMEVGHLMDTDHPVQITFEKRQRTGNQDLAFCIYKAIMLCLNLYLLTKKASSLLMARSGARHTGI
jgi:hypothetical protein